MKSYTLGEIAKHLELELVGDASCVVNGLGTLSNAQPNQIGFLSNPSYIDQLAACQAAAVILSANFADNCPVAALISDSPYVSFAKASALFYEHALSRAGIHPSAIIDDSASVSDSAIIGANVYVGAGAIVGDRTVIEPGCSIGANAKLGQDCHLHSNVTLYHEVQLADRVIIHSGAVIGADGFGFAIDGATSIKIYQLGSVRIDDDVEIGAGTTVDRGAIEDTVIERGVKIDNQVQIAHNCHIGENSIICGCTALAGSVTLGKNCIMGGASGAVGHITIADGVQVSAMSLVSKSILESGRYSSGTGQMRTSEWKRSIVRFQQLDSIARRLKEIERQSDKE